MKYASIKIPPLIAIHAFIAGIIVIITAWYPNQTDGPHGGVVKKAGNYFIEMKPMDKFMYVYLMDADLKEQTNKEVTGEIKYFIAADSSALNIPLKTLSDKIFITDFVPNYGSCKITFYIAANTISAKFENQKLTVKRE